MAIAVVIIKEESCLLMLPLQHHGYYYLCNKYFTTQLAQVFLLSITAFPKDSSVTSNNLSLTRTLNNGPRLWAVLSIEEIPPNAVCRKRDPQWRGGFSLGVDLGLSRTGIAISKGFVVRPFTVLRLQGQKLEVQLLEIAEVKEADELIIGVPKSSDGKETPQSNKVRSVVGRLAVRAAERGLRVYLLDEHGTSVEACDRMVYIGLSKTLRQERSDAYAAVMLLERYFSTSGEGTELVLPKQLDLQEKLRKGLPLDI